MANDDTAQNPQWPAQTCNTGSASTPFSAWGGSSSIGLKRATNEDRFGQRGSIFAVADGMGGLAAGDEASEWAVESALKYGSALGVGASLDEWSDLVRIVNTRVSIHMRIQGFEKFGCTLTIAAVEPGRVVVAHVGDTRLYDIRKGILRQRTVDQNLGNELKAGGQDLEQAAERELPLTGLTSYVGKLDKHLLVEVFDWSPESETRLLLCTDGVHKYVDSEMIAEVISSRSPQDAASELTRLADAAGGRDNATAVVVQL